MNEEAQAASSGLFAVFLLSIYSLVLIPYTIHYFCSAGDDVTTQPVVKVRSAQRRQGVRRAADSRGGCVPVAWSSAVVWRSAGHSASPVCWSVQGGSYGDRSRAAWSPAAPRPRRPPAPPPLFTLCAGNVLPVAPPNHHHIHTRTRARSVRHPARRPLLGLQGKKKGSWADKAKGLCTRGEH